MYTPSDNIKIAVIGGGAAGMMAAGTAQSLGASVTVFESTDRLGKKLAITGKGRCNVTNDSDISVILQNIPRNSRFMYAPLSAFSPEDTKTFFESLGVKLKTERGNRVFPVSDKARDIVEAMKVYSSGARVVYKKVSSVVTDGTRFTVKCKDYTEDFDRVIIATGGRSYPLTGSDGSGYRLAARLGHTVTEITPSLVPLESSSPFPKKMQGLSLRNVKLTVRDSTGRSLYEDFGELLFTHFGVSGPTVLSASAHLRGVDISALTLSIDLKPALDERTLDTRLLSDFEKKANRDLVNSLSDLLPSKMIEPFIDYAGLDGRKKVNSLTREERRKILTSLKSFDIPLTRYRPIEEAIITSGGVEVKEISPKTMESKLVPGLFFAGEVIDVDGYTGGFNLQIAFSTGYLAGRSAAEL